MKRALLALLVLLARPAGAEVPRVTGNGLTITVSAAGAGGLAAGAITANIIAE